MNRSQRCALLIVAALSLVGIARAAPPGDNPSATYDVRAFGAKGDGVTLDTDAINRTIDAASAAGGGTVTFPAGTYLATSVHLKSDITLDLGAGSNLVAAAPGDAGSYDAPEPNPDAGNYQDFGHAHWHNSLIWGDGLHDVAIVGPGRILGTGLARDYTAQTGTGNKAIALKLCRNVTLRDVTIQHGGWFGILATGVDNLTIDNLRIDTNRDGMDIDCCRNVHVANCTVNSPNDDGICLKSSYGLGFARATENVTITNCQVSGYDEGTLLDGTFGRHGRAPTGRIKFGTESNGGFKNITVSNCVFAYCRGLALEEVDGGALEDVSISNITMRDIVNAPIFLRLGGRLRGPSGTTMGALRRVSISHVTVYNADPRSAVIVAGVPDGLIEDVRLQDIRLWYAGGAAADEAALAPKEDERGYPEPGSLGTMPAYGFFLRHVRGITLDGIEVRTLTPDLRPAFRLDDVADVTLSAIDAEHAPDVPTIVLTGVSGFTLRDATGLSDKRIKQADHASI
jgi:polygalacturonase